MLGRADRPYSIETKSGVLTMKSEPYYDLLISIIWQAKDDLVNAYYNGRKNEIESISNDLYFWYSDRQDFADLIIEQAKKDAEARFRYELIRAYISKKPQVITNRESNLRWWFGNDTDLADSAIMECRRKAEKEILQ